MQQIIGPLETDPDRRATTRRQHDAFSRQLELQRTDARGDLVRGQLPARGRCEVVVFTASTVFYAPAYPLEDVFDPTGAGDSFAGGFMGYLARAGVLDEVHFRRAVVYGSAMGSFAVERFSIQRLLEITGPEIRDRLDDFRRLVTFEEELSV